MNNQEKFTIISKKHDGQLHRKWCENYLFENTEQYLLGGNFKTKMIDRTGNVTYTKEPAVFYFPHNCWYNIVLLYTEKDYYYYCNLSSPFTFKGEVLSYVDYDVDMIVSSDFSYTIVDEKEYEFHAQKYGYTNDIKHFVQEGIMDLKEHIHKGLDPFNQTFVKTGYNKLQAIMR